MTTDGPHGYSMTEGDGAARITIARHGKTLRTIQRASGETYFEVTWRAWAVLLNLAKRDCKCTLNCQALDADWAAARARGE